MLPQHSALEYMLRCIDNVAQHVTCLGNITVPFDGTHHIFMICFIYIYFIFLADTSVQWDMNPFFYDWGLKPSTEMFPKHDFCVQFNTWHFFFFFLWNPCQQLRIHLIWQRRASLECQCGLLNPNCAHCFAGRRHLEVLKYAVATR